VNYIRIANIISLIDVYAKPLFTLILSLLLVASISLLVGVLESSGWWHVGTALGSAVVERLTKRNLAVRLLGLHTWLHLRHTWLHGLHGGHSVPWHATCWWGLLRRLSTACLDCVITLHVSRHLVVANLLLELNQLIVQLGVELVSLDKHVG